MKPVFFLPFSELFIEEIHNSSKHDMSVQQYHDCYEIYYQLKGERYLFLHDTCTMLHPGDLVILEPFTLHYSASLDIDYYERIVLNFHLDQLGFMLNQEEIQTIQHNIKPGVYHLSSETMQQTEYSLTKLLKLNEMNGPWKEKLLYSELFLFLYDMYDITSKSEQNPTASAIKNHFSPEIMTAIRYINEHYREDITLDQLAQTVHLSKYHLSRLFHQAVGATYLQYLTNLRLSMVHQLLLTTNLPLHDIAEKAGFSSAAHMNRQFHNNYQLSPREFRRKNSKIV